MNPIVSHHEDLQLVTCLIENAQKNDENDK